MTLPKHLDDAVGRLNEAGERIQRVRERPATAETLRDWLEALTDFSMALSEIYSYGNESVHEKLHELANRTGLKDFQAGRSSKARIP